MVVYTVRMCTYISIVYALRWKINGKRFCLCILLVRSMPDHFGLLHHGETSVLQLMAKQLDHTEYIVNGFSPNNNTNNIIEYYPHRTVRIVYYGSMYGLRQHLKLLEEKRATWKYGILLGMDEIVLIFSLVSRGGRGGNFLMDLTNGRYMQISNFIRHLLWSRFFSLFLSLSFFFSKITFSRNKSPGQKIPSPFPPNDTRISKKFYSMGTNRPYLIQRMSRCCG